MAQQQMPQHQLYANQPSKFTAVDPFIIIFKNYLLVEVL